MAGHAGFSNIPNDNAFFVLKLLRFGGVRRGCSFSLINLINAYR